MNAWPSVAHIMDTKERFLKGNRFLKDALTLATGTFLAQIVPLAVSPLLTRIYSPGDFGLFSVYMSLISVLSAVVTGRYEYAIMLPQEDDDAANVLGVTAVCAILVSTLLLWYFGPATPPSRGTLATQGYLHGFTRFLRCY